MLSANKILKLNRIKDVRKNIEKVCKKIGCKRKNLILLNQVHSNIVHKVTRITKKKLNKVKKGFSYNSGTNSKFLSIKEIKRLIKKIK